MRRKRIYENAFKSGLDDRYIEVIEALYYGRQDVMLEGDITGDLQTKLREGNAYREQYFAKDPLGQFQREATHLCYQLQQAQRRLYDGLAPAMEVKQLQISKYGYYDITCDLMSVPNTEKKRVSHLSVTNTVCCIFMCRVVRDGLCSCTDRFIKHAAVFYHGNLEQFLWLFLVVNDGV